MAIQIWQPGDKIKNDRFEIIERLDSGGFGIIYLAKDTKRNNETIVIKTLNPYLQSKLDFPQRQDKFIEEGIKHRGFKHPHIVKIHSLIKAGDLSGFVMEYIPGHNLREYVKKEGKISEEKSLLYIDQIAQALDCIHNEKYIHRDVHPGNIMKLQDLDRTVLIDFGIAEEFFDETCSVSNNHGMEFYKPVEQYEKSGRFGAYTDIYALAATLYYLLAGVTVGHGAYDFKSIMRKYFRDRGEISIEKVLWDELANLGISEKTQAAIKAGMGIEPSERPQTITEFRELLGFVSTSKIIPSQLTDKIVIFNPEVNSLNDKKNNKILDTFERDLAAIGLADFDADPFAGLSGLLGEKSGEKYTPSTERNDVSSSLYSEGQITLISLSLTQAYAHWEIPARLKRQLREKGGQKLVVRLYDVTNSSSNIDVSITFQAFECNDSDWELEMPITKSERGYLVAEVGYLTVGESWLILARSAPLWIREKRQMADTIKQQTASGRIADIIKQKQPDRKPGRFRADLLIGMGGAPAAHQAPMREPLKLDARGVLAAFRRGQRVFSDMDISSLDLAKAHLPGITLTSSNCAYINLQGANLAAGKFEEADLSDSVLKDTVLSKGYFSHANLQNADLRGADLSEAYLNFANLRGANLCGANLKGVKVTEEQLNQAKTNFMTIFPNGKRGGFW